MHFSWALAVCIVFHSAVKMDVGLDASGSAVLLLPFEYSADDLQESKKATIWYSALQ